MSEMITNGFRGGVLNKRERERLAILAKRWIYLVRRVAMTNGARSFDMAEASVLRWAIETITGEEIPGMVCFYAGCCAELWRQTRALTEAAAIEAGWRFQTDAKAPALSVGVALCPDHVKHAADFQPAAKARTA